LMAMAMALMRRRRISGFRHQRVDRDRTLPHW
jgi:hypothetical protein